MSGTPWPRPELSTASPAAEHYVDGVAALVAGAAHARRHLTAALAADPLFALAHVAAAVADGRPVAVPTGARTSRGERHHIETARAWLDGDARHARDLRREHLLEYPGDLLIVALPLLVPVTRSSVSGRAAGGR
jgi:hypothetical protein